jgi:hypothetical protein
MNWKPIETAKFYEIVKVKNDDGGEYYAEKKSRGCTGMCVPNGHKIHTPHMHKEWVIVNIDGEELHPIDGYQTINPVKWKPVGDLV